MLLLVIQLNLGQFQAIAGNSPRFNDVSSLLNKVIILKYYYYYFNIKRSSLLKIRKRYRVGIGLRPHWSNAGALTTALYKY